MKIVHLVQHYMPGYTYQENYLPAEMARLGHEVTLIAGIDNPSFYTGAPHLPGDMQTENGMKIRYAKMHYLRFHTPIDGIYQLLQEEQPDLVFVHGFVLARSFGLAKYARRHTECMFCADTHETYLLAYNACFSGSLKDRIRRAVYFRIVYRLWARWMEQRYQTTFYVTPPRRTFAVRELGFSETSLTPLWLGAQLDTLPYAQKASLRLDIRAKLNLPPDAKIIVLAGKLDEKKRPVELAEAFARLDSSDWWLLFAGSMENGVRVRVDCALRDNERIRYTGFLPGEEILEYIAASDIAIYPGAHSVLWEQTVCLGIPAAFHEPEPGDAAHLSDSASPGALFLQTGSADELFEVLTRLTGDESNLVRMGENARAYGLRRLSYAQLARDALETLGFQQENMR